jgi:CDGSH-type Zn-finger protein
MADQEQQRIIVVLNGPYVVLGGVPLVRKEPVMSEHGEPLTWQRGEVLSTAAKYALCRCGHSAAKPFCDGAHLAFNFDGAETAETGDAPGRTKLYQGQAIVVKDDRSLCMHAGFCGNRATNVWKLVADTADAQVRAQVMAMVEQCPSGALSFGLEPQGEVVEPSLPREIAVTPDGALWVSGGISVERSDGKPFEGRNRVTLCRCGHSSNKPLCDGTHKESGFSDR